MRYVEAPNWYKPIESYWSDPPGIFLAGGITGCPDWQAEVVATLQSHDIDAVVFNPRRRDFDTSQDIADEQIAWEHHHMRRADLVMFWFPRSFSPQPIALYELGSFVHGDLGAWVVGCDPGYIRRRDVQIQLALSVGLARVHDSLDETIDAALDTLRVIELTRRPK